MSLVGLSEAKQPDGTDVCAQPFAPPASAEELRRLTLQALSRHNILAVTFGTDLSVVDAWQHEQPDRILPGIQTTGENLDIPVLRQMLKSGKLAVIGEVTSQYAGLAPSDPKLEPLFALAEEVDRPVGIVALADRPDECSGVVAICLSVSRRSRPSSVGCDPSLDAGPVRIRRHAAKTGSQASRNARPRAAIRPHQTAPQLPGVGA